MGAEASIQSTYSRLCQARLETAALLLEQRPACHVESGIDAVIARCNIAMLLWSAAVDAGSSLMVQESQRRPSGNSSEITIFIAQETDSIHPELRLKTLWRRLVQLHNIQHRADHQSTRFLLACGISYQAFEALNFLLAPEHRFPAESFAWLAEFGAAQP